MCLCSTGAGKKDPTIDVVDGSFADAIASLVTCLLVKSRMALVAMLMMSGLWVRLHSEPLLESAAARIPADRAEWDLKTWRKYLRRRLQAAAQTSKLQWHGVVDSANKLAEDFTA